MAFVLFLQLSGMFIILFSEKVEPLFYMAFRLPKLSGIIIIYVYFFSWSK